MNRAILTALAVCTLALAACDKPQTTDPKSDDPASKNATTTGATATVAATTTAPAPAAAVAIADTDLSTPADFEEAAEKSITAKTYKADLAALETEIGKE